MNNPNYIVVLFDKEQEILRQSINENYKNNRINYNDVPDDDEIKDLINKRIGIKIDFWDKLAGTTPYPGKRR